MVLPLKNGRLKILKLSLCLLFFCTAGQAQGDRQGPYLTVSYFGILGTHPGLKIGLEHPIVNWSKDKVGRSNEGLLGANIIFYYHRRNQIGLGGTLEFGYRNLRVNGLHKSVNLGIGYLRTFLPNKVHDFDRTNSPSKGTGYFLKTIGIGIGRSFHTEMDSDFWMIRPTILHLSPFNMGSTLNFALDAGVYFH